MPATQAWVAGIVVLLASAITGGWLSYWRIVTLH